MTQNSEQVLLPIIPYYYYAVPQIEKLIPNKGPIDGGTKIEIKGLNMYPLKDIKKINISQHTIFKFGKYNTEFKLISIFYAFAFSPKVNSPGKVLVKVRIFFFLFFCCIKINYI